MKKKNDFTVSDSRKFDRKILDEPITEEPQKEITMSNYFAVPAAPMNHPAMIMQAWISTLTTIRHDAAKLEATRQKNQRSIGVSDIN